MSVAFHLILLLILFLIKINLEPEEEEFVTIGFGSIGNLSSAGVLAENPTQDKQTKEPEEQKEIKNTSQLELLKSSDS